MKSIGSVIVIVGILVSPLVARAGEHPEHPKAAPEATGEQTKEHKVEMLKVKEQIKEYAQEIERVAKEYQLPVNTVEGKGVLLPKSTELVKIHTDKIIRYKGDTYFACADFKDAKGTMYDLDFYMTRGEQGWTLDKVLYHKLNGKLQCTYNEHCEAVPVKK